MLIPRVSLRSLFGVTAVFALAYLALTLAMREHAWAVGISAALVTGVAVFLVHAALFGVVWLYQQARDTMRRDVRPRPQDVTAPGESTPG